MKVLENSARACTACFHLKYNDEEPSHKPLDTWMGKELIVCKWEKEEGIRCLQREFQPTYDLTWAWSGLSLPFTAL